jgi:hypothetical protein
MHFPRKQLAEQLVTALRGGSLFGDAENGIFLAAPRRTGKSTFLQRDLQPALEAQGVVVVYVDLWANPKRDPGDLIAEAIGAVLGKHLNLLSKAVRLARLSSLSVGGATIDTSKVGAIDGLTLANALRALHAAAGAQVALIIDEAQQAVTTTAGEAAMTALKSARDQLNRPGDVKLMLVMSGSDRDKLLRLVNTAGAPFYGSTVSTMPLLGRDFVDHLVQRIERSLPQLVPVDADKLMQAFECFGHRPQFFRDALNQAVAPLNECPVRLEQAVLEAAERKQTEDEEQMESEYLGLRPVERAMVWRLLALGGRFQPYGADALAFYAQVVGKSVSVTRAQKALESLRSRTPSLVWKSARGEYAVEDAAMHRWYERRVAEGRWPPQARHD